MANSTRMTTNADPSYITGVNSHSINQSINRTIDKSINQYYAET